MSSTGPGADLPVLSVLDELLAALASHGTAVLVAPPGTSKTTGVPPRLVAQPWVGDGRIVVVEPRRLAARAAATHMAELAGEPVGRTVGYSVRGERRVSDATRIEVVTEGLFLRRLQRDPTLDGVAAVLLDEFHERSLDVDLALALLADVRSSLRPDLRLVVMSATIDPVPVADLLGGVEVGPDVGSELRAGAAPVIEATAPMFDVATHHLAGSAHDPLEERVAEAVRVAVRDDRGDVLVFLPGRPEIHRVERLLTRSRGGGPTDVDILALHGSLSPAEQADVVGAHDGSRRRVILSTSLAETSITVPGVRVVIDAGRRRTVRIDAHTGLPALRTGPTSRAGADQRRGRAGRVGPGVCYRLWGESEHRHRPAADTPEIVDGDLAALVLQLRAWGVADPGELRWLDPPSPEAIERAATLLGELGALDAENRLTASGREMAGIGFHPRLAAVALEGRRSGRTDLAAEVIAVLETSRAGEPDVVERVRALRAGRATGDVTHALRMWQRSLGVRSGSAAGGALEESVARLLLAGSADRVALRRATVRTDDRGRSRQVFHLRSGGEVALDPDDPLARSDWLVVADLDAGAPGQPGRMHLAAALPERAVADVVEPLIETHDVVEWDVHRREVRSERHRQLGAITVDVQPLRDPDAGLVRAALVEGVRSHGPTLLAGLDRTAELRRRVAWLRATRPDDGWPDWSDQGLTDDLEHWLVPLLGRARRAEDLDRVDVRAALLDSLDWQQRRSLDELAPTHWTTASGRRVALRYGEVDGESSTVLAAVALRDVIGTDAHPTVGSSRTPITLELLSPAGRPLQRTADLPGFWRGSYSAVRAEMRGRYPKHPWPERPWETA